jgi:hypothetical protein
MGNLLFACFGMHVHNDRQLSGAEATFAKIQPGFIQRMSADWHELGFEDSKI